MGIYEFQNLVLANIWAIYFMENPPVKAISSTKMATASRANLSMESDMVNISSNKMYHKIF
jgi:hypothetical protein